MLTFSLIISTLMQSQFSSRSAVVKVYDGKSWSIRGLIKNNDEWNGFIREIRSQKLYFSHGFCCYNDKFINGIEIEGGDQDGRYVINNASPNGKTQTFQMYWRPYRMQQIPDEPGYSQAATKQLSLKMNRFINDAQKMEYATESSLNACGGKFSGILGDCTTRYELRDSTKYNTTDSSKYTYIRNYHVFLNRKKARHASGSWTTVLDTGGYVFAVPTSAIQDFDKMQGVVTHHYKGQKDYILSRNISLVAWGLKHYECSILDKASRKLKASIPLEAISNKCGDLCDNYQEYLIIDDSTRILIYGYGK